MTASDTSRVQAYNATRERLDARRTARVKCKPPNRQCGNRCIPPNWDCRLKGEGEDGHLRAVGKGSDPVSGLANIERGLGRLRTAAVKLSFSELEGGRKAIARGTAKLSPGDLKKKEEVKKNVDFFLGRVLLPATAVVGATLMHRGLKNFKGYREGVGQQIDDSARSAINLVRTNIPIYGDRVRRRQQIGVEAVGAINRSVGSIESRGAASLAREPGTRRSLSEMVRSQTTSNVEGTAADVESLLTDSLRSVDGAVNNRSRPSRLSYDVWESRSLTTFWSTPRTPRVSPVSIGQNGSVFSIHATNDLLAKSFGLPAPNGGDLKQEGELVISRMTQLFKATGAGIKTSMREAGLNPKDPDAVRNYIGKVGGSSLADNQATRILVDTVTRSDYETQAKSLYKKTVSSYDRLFQRVADDLQQAPSIDLVVNRGNEKEQARLRKMRQNTFYNDAIEAHSVFIGRAIDLPAPVYGTYTGTLAKRTYHTRFVAGSKRLGTNNDVNITLTRTEAFNAGVEIARATGAPEPATTQEALDLVVRTYGRELGQNVRGNAIGSISLVQQATRSRGQTSTEATSQERPARRRQRSRDAIIRDLIRAGYSPEGAATEADRIIASRRRADAYLLVREDFTPTRERTGKPCGKSFIGKNEKCSKPGAKGYVDPAQGQNPTTDLLNNAAKVATIASGVATVVGAIKNRKKLRVAARKGDIKLRKALKKNNRQAHKAYVRVRVQRRAVGAVVRQRTAEVVPELSKRVIKRLSSQEVTDGINKLPKQYRERASRLVGDAKLSAAHMALRARGAEITDVDTVNNFSNWRTKNGAILSTGSVGESLVIYNTTPQESLGGARTYSTQFRIDGEFDAKSTAAASNAKGIASLVKKMFNSQVEQLPDNSIIYAIPYANDKKGGKRSAIYRRYGFRQALSSDERLFAMKTKGKFTKMKDSHIDQIADLIRNDSTNLDDSTTTTHRTTRFDFTPKQERTGKPCGKSFIPKNQKCTKATTARYTEQQETSNLANDKLKVAAGTAAVAGGIAVLAAMGVSRSRVSAYRKNVSKSALEAEKLALELERKFREDAAKRLKKRPQDVTGFEASVYNFKDKGRDGGFGSMDSDPAWFGQTKSSKGAVVMLSYADDNKFTNRGQGSYMMAKGGAFQQIWGDRDIIPYSNNISQPVDKIPDDLQVKKREAFIDKAEKLGGATGKNVAKAGMTIKDTFKRFKFLRENIERGFNPDAVRAAAFVVAQRRLTGKSVDIMSYSNGGNVATETLAILKEMGYRDVKVVNVAGPTFGMFSHSEDNMRTWVSEGDDFYKISKGLAFQGGNTRILKNPNIPHGLSEKIDPNNREYGKDYRANVKAKNSYTLDEQLQREAYKFLTVDRKRSGELLDEVIFFISEKKPMKGDLANLFGNQSGVKIAEFTKRMNNTRDREATKSQIRDEIEDLMLERWYGGYNPKNVKNAQRKIRSELEQQINPAPRTTQRRPQSANQIATDLMKQNPGMSRAAALKEARRRMLESKTDSAIYLDAYNLTRARLLTACA